MRGNMDFGAMTKRAQGGFDNDPDQFSYSLGNNGTFEAVLRPLGAPDSPDGIPWIELRYHKFKDVAGREHKEQCAQMIPGKSRKDCPMCETISPWWDMGREADYRNYKSQRQFMMNVGVIKNTAAPDTEGKVFVLVFGWQVFEKIQGMLAPVKGGVRKPTNVFDPLTGNNFVFRVRKKGGHNNYESSEWEASSALSDDLMNSFDKQLHNLQPYLKKRIDAIKSYDEFAKITYTAMGGRENVVGYIAPAMTGGVPAPQPNAQVQQQSQPTVLPQTTPLPTETVPTGATTSSTSVTPGATEEKDSTPTSTGSEPPSAVGNGGGSAFWDDL